MNKTAMCFGLAAMVFVFSVPAQAGGYGKSHNFGGHYGGGYYGGGHYGGGHSGFSYGRHRGYGQHGGYGRHDGHRYYGSGGADLAAGLLIGGLIGWAAGDRHTDRYYADRRYDYRYRPHRHAYYESVPSSNDYEAVQKTDTTEACTMTREYTTKVEIDGVQREAYGTRCRKADGSWSYGPLTLVPAGQ